MLHNGIPFEKRIRLPPLHAIQRPEPEGGQRKKEQKGHAPPAPCIMGFLA